MLRVGTIFSGCGGADMGLVAAGMEIVWACEIDPKPRAVYRRHFLGTHIYFDAKEMKGHALEPVDALFFGSPCQDLSVAGAQAGLAGERSGLFFEAMRIVDEMAAPPGVAVWENVCGALSSNGGRDFATILTEMGKRWSGIAYRVLDLQYFGPPQRRSRVFVVGHSGGWQRATEILFEPEGVRWNPPARGEQGQASPTIPSRSTAGGGLGTDFDCGGGLVAGPLLANGKAAGSATQQDAERGMLITGCSSGHSEYNAEVPTLRAQRGDSGGGSEALVAFGGNRISGPIDVAARLGCNESGGGYRLDFESDTLIAHTLRADGFDASEDGTGRGTPLVPMAFRHLASASDTGVPQEDLAPALRAADDSGLSVCFDTTQITSKGNRSNPRPGNPCHSLASGAHAPAIATLAIRGRGCESSLEVRTDGTANTLLTPNGGRAGIGCGAIQKHMQVRRLTPVECHRLMGWPDDWCAWGIDDNGKRIEIADGPQYKMIGNGIGKPHAEWIGRRIMEAA